MPFKSPPLRSPENKARRFAQCLAGTVPVLIARSAKLSLAALDQARLVSQSRLPAPRPSRPQGRADHYQGSNDSIPTPPSSFLSMGLIVVERVIADGSSCRTGLKVVCRDLRKREKRERVLRQVCRLGFMLPQALHRG